MTIRRRTNAEFLLPFFTASAVTSIAFMAAVVLFVFSQPERSTVAFMISGLGILTICGMIYMEVRRENAAMAEDINAF